MISFLPSLVTNSSSPQDARLDDVADHIMYAGERIGYSHVGIGSDFDGMLEGPRGLDQASDYPELVAELLRRGVGEEALRNVCGGNLIRVMREVEKCAAAMQDAGENMFCDDVGFVWTKEQREMIAARGAQRRVGV